MTGRKIYSLGLIGWPVAHSVSPVLHQAALQHYNLAGGYTLFPIPPTADGEILLQEILSGVIQGQIQGLNVTIPYKQAIIHLLDVLTPTAKAVGAVNTILLQEGRLKGENTDVAGFLRDLNRFLGERSTGSGSKPKTALVLGAGGAARAVCYALLKTDWQVTLAARRIEQARNLADEFSLLPEFDIQTVTIRTTALNGPDLTTLSPGLIVNTTPLGMSPYSERSPWPEGLSLPPNAAVYDLVYNPEETPLIRQARQTGLSAASGAGMLIEQAALSFRLWTGSAAPIEPMRRAYNTVKSTQLEWEKE